MAQRWQAEGAERLHIVDLDGARSGMRANADVIQRLLRAARIPVQVGGGVRSLEVATDLLRQGADRVVFGTAAVEHADELERWVDTVGADHLVVAVDARNGMVATHGWQRTSDLDAVTFCQKLREKGVRRVLYTDVERDGMLGGPNIQRTRQIADVLAVLASGGVSSIQHLRQLGEAGAEGAIIGTALYTGQLELRDALAETC